MSTCEEQWKPVVIKHHRATFERDVYRNYEVSSNSSVRNTVTKRMLSDKSDQVGLCGGGIRKNLKRYHICLASFFPYDIPVNIEKYDCDHIDGNHDNNVLSNLQWLTKSDHAKKTHCQTKGNRKSFVEKQGKKVRVIDVMGTGNIELKDTIYNSCHCAARELGIRHDCINQSAIRGCWVNKQYKFEFVVQSHIEGEIFKAIGDYKVSNKGRVIMKRGNITIGSNTGRNTKYRTVGIKLEGDTKKRNYLVHILVWLVHVGQIPDGMLVMHNDSYQTLDNEGKERNHLEDLSLGTHSENTQSYHDNRTDLKRVRCLDNDTVYFSVSTAAKELGLHGSGIWNVCQKKRKTTGGKIFEYC